MYIKKKLYNINRYFMKKYLTGNLGKVVEEQDRLVCYVNNIRKCKKGKYTYIIACCGRRKKDEDLADVYKLNKPIVYVIDGVKFDKNIYVFGYNNCEIYIRNCEISYDTYIRVNGKCTIENTIIKALSSLMISAEELILKNMDLRNHYHYSSNLRINLGAIKKMEIINSNIGREKEKTNISVLTTNELNVINSKIAGDVVECEGSKMNYDSKSSISASKKANLKVSEFEKIDITCPDIILNDASISTGKESIALEKLEDSLKIKRIELVELFKKLRNACNQINTEKVEEYKNSLNNETVARTLKRKQ